MDFVFKKEPDLGSLQQGDLLLKTPALANALAEAHSYYASAEDYTHFLVLTQSCELVRRGGGKPKARYITVAAVRPLNAVIERFLEKHKFQNDQIPIPLCNAQKRIWAEQLLERLLHNTEDGYFFFRKGSCPSITEDLCAFLMLSVAMKNQHYETCLEAKIAQLDDIFAAKVGWLSGNLYSRIATPDIEEKVSDPEKYKEEFYSEALFSRTAWLTPEQYQELKKNVTIWKRNNPDQPITNTIAETLIRELPQPIDLISRRIADLLVHNDLLAKEPETINKAKTLLENDKALVRLLRSYC